MNRTFLERKLGSVILRVYQTTADLYDIFPNDRQPRQGDKEDLELRRQIAANNGLFEPLLVEPFPEEGEEKYHIIDGERRWTNIKSLVEEENRPEFRSIPVIVTEKPLSQEQRLRIWIYIHRQRKEWSLKEKEGVANRLVELTSPALAADMLGISVRALEKLVETFRISKRISPPNDPDASISYAREIVSLATRVRTDEVVNAIISKINNGKIGISKDIRGLRKVLKEEIAKQEFISPEGTIESAISKLSIQGRRRQDRYGRGLIKDIEAFIGTLNAYPYRDVIKLKGDENVISKLTECEEVVKSLKSSLS